MGIKDDIVRSLDRILNGLVLLSVSVTFYGRSVAGTPIHLDVEDGNYLNMATANARAFLEFLGIEPGDEPSGEVSIHAARRAVIRAQATFERRVGRFVREGSDTKRPGEVRVIVGGIDESYVQRRLSDFERFVIVVGAMGATVICWA